MLSICYPYVIHILSICYPYVIHIFSICYPYIVHMLSICYPYIIHMLSICYPYIIHILSICYPYVSICYPYVIHMLSICYPYVIHMLSMLLRSFANETSFHSVRNRWKNSFKGGIPSISQILGSHSSGHRAMSHLHNRLIWRRARPKIIPWMTMGLIENLRMFANLSMAHRNIGW